MDFCRADWIQIFKRCKGIKKDACKSDRSRQEISNGYFVSKVGFDTAKNESSKVYQIVARQLDRLS